MVRNLELTVRVGEDVPVAEALAVLQVRALDLSQERAARGRRRQTLVRASKIERERDSAEQRHASHLVSRRRGAEEEPRRELAPVHPFRGRREHRQNGQRHDGANASRRGHLARTFFYPAAASSSSPARRPPFVALLWVCGSSGFLCSDAHASLIYSCSRLFGLWERDGRRQVGRSSVIH